MTDCELLQMALDALSLAVEPKKGKVYAFEFQPIDCEAMHIKAIEALRARLAQPEPAQCDGGQCGIGGYCKQCPKTQPEQKLVVKLKELLEVQGRDGTWNYDHYFHGMYNGMEVMLAVLEGREPVFREAPKKWLSKKEWVGLTDDEMFDCLVQADGEAKRLPFGFKWFAEAIEAKLKEKNT